MMDHTCLVHELKQAGTLGLDWRSRPAVEQILQRVTILVDLPAQNVNAGQRFDLPPFGEPERNIASLPKWDLHLLLWRPSYGGP